MKQIISTEEDIQYFKDKLARMKERGASKEAMTKTKKQLDLIKDSAVIYKLENPCRI